MEIENLKDLSSLVNIPGRGRFHESARRERVQFLRQQTGADLSTFDQAQIPAESLRGNIENYIGTLALPVGVAGPLLLHHSKGQGKVFAPIATTEGALVASITRGARALSLSGGAHARFISQAMTRAPFFELKTLESAFEFADWLRERLPELRKLVKTYSNFSELKSLETRHLGRVVHVVFSYVTADAAGQNMTTICTWQLCQWLLERMRGKFELRRFCLEGNLSSDKKASVGSMMRGRGSEVTADCLIPGHVLKEILLVSARDMANTLSISKAARIQSGMLSNNINTANLIAGIFTATGQDIGCVHESSLAEFHLEAQGEDLYASIYLPSVVIGTVGGGTRFNGQMELLQLMDCFGADRVEQFAETIAGFALALDLSTLAAIVGGQFAKAHTRLGRPPADSGLRRNDLETFVGKAIGASRVEPLVDFHAGDSMIMELSSQVTSKLCGFFPFQVAWATGEEDLVLMKLKPTDSEIMLATEMMGTMCGQRLGELLIENQPLSTFKSCHEKEMQILKMDIPVLRRLAPKVYAALIQPRKGIFASITRLERDLEVQNAADHLRGWSLENIQIAIREISAFHGVHYAQTENLAAMPWIGFVPTSASLQKLTPLFEEMSRLANINFPSWYDVEMRTSVEKILTDLPVWSRAMEALPKTLIHGDFNPRNLAFRKNSEARLCVFDWELATIHVPQRDLVELLAFCNVTESETLLHLIEFHRAQLQLAVGVAIAKEPWMDGCRLALRELMIHRLQLYSVAHVHRHCEFLPRTFRAALKILQILEDVGDDPF